MINSSKTEIVPCSVLKDDDFAIFMAPLAKNWAAEETETPLYVQEQNRIGGLKLTSQ